MRPDCRQAKRMGSARFAVCFPERVFVHYGGSRPVGWRMGDEPSDEGFRSGK